MARRSKPNRKPNYRKPPRPESWDIPRGNCRFCGGEIIENGKQNRRKHWHKDCVTMWKIMNDPKVARKFIFVRDRGECRECHMFSPLMGEFEVDHIKPLFEAHGDPEYYGPENMQLLCIPCHLKKTAEDMKLFHEIKKILKNIEPRS